MLKMYLYISRFLEIGWSSNQRSPKDISRVTDVMNGAFQSPSSTKLQEWSCSRLGTRAVMAGGIL